MYRVSGFGYDPKNPPPLWIIWINNPFLDFMKETKNRFWIKNPDLDFSKETHTKSLFELVQYNCCFVCACCRPFRLALQLNGKLRVTDILKANIT